MAHAWLRVEQRAAVGEEERALSRFVQKLARLRRRHPVFRRGRFFRGKRTSDTEIKDITWLRPDGREKEQEDWDRALHCLGFVVSGEAGHYHLTAEGVAEADHSFLVLMNAGAEPVDYCLPRFGSAAAWELVLDTGDPEADGEAPRRAPGERFPLGPRRLLLFVMHEHHPAGEEGDGMGEGP